MNNIEICLKCIHFDDFVCRYTKTICVNNCEYEDAETIITAYIASLTDKKEGIINEVIR